MRIVEDYQERVVTVALDDGDDLDDLAAAAVADSVVNGDGDMWLLYDTERLNYDKVRVRFRL